MPDTLTTITNLINSPPGQLVAGGVLAGIVWKFFERVEAVLNDDTKLEIAVWLVGLKTSEKARLWPESFISLMTRVFGDRKLSWHSFWRSCLATYGCITVGAITTILFSATARRSFLMTLPRDTSGTIIVIGIVFALPLVLILLGFTNCVPDYFSLLKTRFAIAAFAKTTSNGRRIAIMISDLAGSLAVGLSSLLVIMFLNWRALHSGVLLPDIPAEYKLELAPYMARKVRGTLDLADLAQIVVLSYPAFFGAIWFLLFAGSGFLLKTARRFDVGFAWFNRRFDIEHKPLQSIGLVAGGIVAVVYWTFVVVHHFLA